MKIKLLINKKKDWAVKLGKEAVDLLEETGVEVTNSKVDVSVCVGGDGTIYHYYNTGEIEGGILAIGSKTSSVCQIVNNNWKDKLLRFLKRNKREKRLALTARVDGRSYFSMNDVVVHTYDYRLIRLNVKIARSKYSFEGDGLIVSTPTGSTGYAYSAGGSIIKPTEKIIQVVPICPYKREFSPRIITENEKVETSTDRGADLIIDGIYIKRLEGGEKALVQRGKDVEFLV
ncbi:NAD(+)/NADH kinase [Candidatus Micrarchaeota archaeon]|nr:NAD(+)/NADH kinase [Candidatus Micrarchaeota archaeon]